MIKIALAGNPNCGKTTMFNGLTGSNQYVGNWPGVTVEKKEGTLKGNKDVVIQDLPGIYSLSPYTMEEVVSRNYLIQEQPDVILNIIDASNLERNLYLTSQLLEVGVPVVIALNMMDIVEKRKDSIDVDALSKKLGCPIVKMSALKNQGIKEAANAAVKAAQLQQLPEHQTFDTKVEKALNSIGKLLNVNDHKRWYAIKVLENDEKIINDLQLTNIKEIDMVRSSLENDLDDDAESIITDARYTYIQKLLAGVYVRNKKGALTTSDKIDRIVTNRWLALPIFVVVMGFIYWVSVTSLGTIVTDWTNDTLFGEWIQPAVASFLTSIGCADWLNSLVVDGIIGGIAAPIGFAPQMAILFFFMAILEDCGYMSRVAFIMDRIFRRFGLSGKSFISFMISSGCGVPGIMSTRTIENENDRRMTIITTTTMPCGAKLPVISLIAGALMADAENAWWYALSIYFFGILCIIISSLILKKTKYFAGDPAPFIMELPAYHMPTIKNVFLHVWERLWSFLKKAGTVLFVCCGVMWFLVTFGFENGSFGMVEEGNSLLAMIGGFIAPLFIPLGFGSWQPVAASLSGFVAKEQIVSTIAVLVGKSEESAALFTASRAMFATDMAALSFLIFNLLDSPCLAALSTVAKEMNSKKWTTFAIVFQQVFAYCVTLVVYQLGSWIAYGTFTVWTFVAIVILVGMIYMMVRPVSKKALKLQEA